MGSVASFENMIPNFANINNTHTVEWDLRKEQRPTSPPKPVRPSTSQLSNKAPKRMVSRVKVLKNIVDYRPVTPGHITMFDQ